MAAQVDERMARIEGILEQIDKRLSNLEVRFQSFENSTGSQFRWMVGIMLSMWVTIILTIALKG